jgi:hypothetical protein
MKFMLIVVEKPILAIDNNVNTYYDFPELT